MGEIVSVRVSTAMMRSHELPGGLRVTWDEGSAEEVSRAEGEFYRYLREGWLAFIEGEDGKKQILRFDPKLPRIILIPPIGGG